VFTATIAAEASTHDFCRLMVCLALAGCRAELELSKLFSSAGKAHAIIPTRLRRSSPDYQITRRPMAIALFYSRTNPAVWLRSAEIACLSNICMNM
jgi:hypothetical protein